MTGTQQPADTKDDISPDLSSYNKALFFSPTMHPPNITFPQNSIPYSCPYQYRTFCTTYGNPVKPGSIWHFHSWDYLLQHTSKHTEILQQYHMQQVLPGSQRTSTITKYITTGKSFMTPCTHTTTNPSPNTKPIHQTLNIYTHEPDRPGPPWPLPTTHTDTVIALTKNLQPFTVTRLSHARPHLAYLP